MLQKVIFSFHKPLVALTFGAPNLECKALFSLCACSDRCVCVELDLEKYRSSALFHGKYRTHWLKDLYLASPATVSTAARNTCTPK